ncbi:MAG: hypothetical protein J6U23_10055 [Clostridiales bacterium]|nr:hypothetical protein [Clostridiales bacterium]
MFFEFANTIKESSMLPKNGKNLVAGYLSMEELLKIAPALNVADSTVDACKTANTIFRSGVEIYDDYTFTELKVVDPVHCNGLETDNDDSDYVALYIMKNALYVVDVLDTDRSTYEKFIRATKRFTPATMTLEKLIYAFFDELLSKDVSFIEKLSLQVTEMEESILHGKPDDDINLTLLRLKRKLLEIRNYYEQCLDIFEVLEADENELFSENDALMYMVNMNQRITRLREDVDSINNAVVHVQDAYSVHMDAKMNNTMKYLTVLTTIFFPLTIIVGWYGMNFESMPEFKWQFGYIYVIILSIAVIVMLAFIARKNKWF